MTPTEEQEAIYRAGRESQLSLMISALAGTGKTTTLTGLANIIPPKPSLALAFNVKIKDELQKRFPAHFEVKTMNGLGHTAWSRYVQGRPRVDDRKLGTLVTQTLSSHGLKVDQDEWGDIRRLVTAAMNVGLVPSDFPKKGWVTDTEANWLDLALDEDCKQDFWPIAREVLVQSIKLAFGASPVISYDDQIYLPTMLGASFPRFPIVMVDEAQDLSPLQHEMVKRVASDRIIVCGDPKQAIYGFRGADHTSMESLRAIRDSWIDLPLTLTFRCPKAVVERQQEHAPGYRAHESNVEGRIINLQGREEGWTWNDVPPGEVAVLCRNNAPLLSLALKLLAKHVSVHMLGRDIGKGLVSLAKKILPDRAIPTALCVEKINSWRQSESDLAKANQKEHKISGIEDRAECLLAVLEHCNNAGELCTTLSDIFARDRGQVTLSSGHRAKGLEWQHVLILDPFRIPSKYARKAAARGDDRQLMQEYNLRYVCETRAKESLILANLEDFS